MESVIEGNTLYQDAVTRTSEDVDRRRLRHLVHLGRCGATRCTRRLMVMRGKQRLTTWASSRPHAEPPQDQQDDDDNGGDRDVLPHQPHSVRVLGLRSVSLALVCESRALDGDVFDLLSPAQDVADVFRHDGVDVAELGLEAVDVALGAGVEVDAFCFLDEGVEADEFVRARRGGDLGAVDCAEFHSELLEVVVGESLGVGFFGECEEDDAAVDDVVEGEVVAGVECDVFGGGVVLLLLCVGVLGKRADDFLGLPLVGPQLAGVRVLVVRH
mmetsp:Transcript_19290/g.51210  ORF Transcript_19290/g.51210 Transcript_19290/m.51210 type:complete len:271 (-) Transcript_19290:181-993(-)